MAEINHWAEFILFLMYCLVALSAFWLASVPFTRSIHDLLICKLLDLCLYSATSSALSSFVTIKSGMILRLAVELLNDVTGFILSDAISLRMILISSSSI